MRGISGGGVAAVSAPCCPYCQLLEGLPFFPFSCGWLAFVVGTTGAGGCLVWVLDSTVRHWARGGGAFHWKKLVAVRLIVVPTLESAKAVRWAVCFALTFALAGAAISLDLLRGWLCERMSVSCTVSCMMSVLACLKVTPARVCMAICQEKVFQASLTCGMRSACRLMSCSNRWM